jgi:hypothetical protein
MNKRILKIMSFACILALASSCERDLKTEGITTRITYYAVIEPVPFEVDGEETVDLTIDQDDAYTDPGAVVTEAGQPIEYETAISGTYFVDGTETLDSSIPDIYNITYSAVNKDGYAGSVVRNVFVRPTQGDLVTSIEGLYTVSVVRSPGGGPATADYTDREYAFIRKVDSDTYEISDAIGGYYDFGRAYGPTYAARGARVTAVNIPGSIFTYDNSVGVGEFGGVATVGGMVVNPVNKTVEFTTTWDAGYSFKVTMKQVVY